MTMFKYELFMTVEDLLRPYDAKDDDGSERIDLIDQMCKDAHTRKYKLCKGPEVDFPSATIESAVWAGRDHIMFVVVCDDCGHHHMLRTGDKIPGALKGLTHVCKDGAYNEKVRKIRRKFSRDGEGGYLDDSKMIARLIELGEGD